MRVVADIKVGGSVAVHVPRCRRMCEAILRRQVRARVAQLAAGRREYKCVRPASERLVVVAVINGIAAAPFLVVIMMISADRAIMGELRNGPVATALGWSTVAIMAGAALLMVTTGWL